MAKKNRNGQSKPTASAKEKTYGDWSGKLGVGEVQKTDNGFCAVVQIGNDTTTPEPFKTFAAAEEWVKDTIEAD